MNELTQRYFEASQEIENPNIIASNAITVTSDGEFVGINNTHTLSKRATGNFCKDTGIPRKVLTSNSETVVNQLFQEQIVNRNIASFRYSVLPTEEIVFMQNASEPFLSYAEQLNSIADRDVVAIDGTYIDDDFIRVFTEESTITVGNQSYGMGLVFRMSSTFRVPFRIDYTIHTPNPITIKASQTKMNSEDINFDSIRSLTVNVMDKYDEIKGFFSSFATEARNFALTPFDESVIQDMEESRHIPIALTKKIKEQFKEFEDFNYTDNIDYYKQAGIINMDNLWEYICFGAYSATKLDKLQAREKCENGLFRWAYYKLHPKF